MYLFNDDVTLIFIIILVSRSCKMSTTQDCNQCFIDNTTLCPRPMEIVSNVDSTLLPSLVCVEHPKFLSVFDFPTSLVKSIDCNSDNVIKLIKLSEPLILKNCRFFDKARHWNLSYLSKTLWEEYAIYVSNSRKFLYYDSTVDYSNYEKNYGWRPPFRTHFNSFQEFLNMASELTKVKNGSFAYFQTLLHNDDFTTSLHKDMRDFNYTWLLHTVFELGWSTNVLNMLFVGMPDVITRLHYDVMQNVFIQLQGWKRFILFSPDHFGKLYPYPLGHPHDRQSMVDIEYPDYQRFPKFRHVKGLMAILGPGDVLYLPSCWWHEVESNRNDFTVSLNFWFEENFEETISRKMKNSAIFNVSANFTLSEEMIFRRYIESLVFNATRNTQMVKEIFQDILHGRFEEI
ncbi:hypoxia-inducible factor 1-alpha inhibitor-like [Xenia sp. Carnegie-2017]|uniref:hypoxia-inducible factor 1-alpha inhibitor-like n=1 Tax=Xenia sp. Carnegie-2017 TaxID=2897299 RepID=UPI001F044AC2|nr:hypoxia-inducible factor 1-alpha inhibitor-like [Xenia sp. Carnegie-2017]